MLVFLLNLCDSDISADGSLFNGYRWKNKILLSNWAFWTRRSEHIPWQPVQLPNRPRCRQPSLDKLCLLFPTIRNINQNPHKKSLFSRSHKSSVDIVVPPECHFRIYITIQVALARSPTPISMLHTTGIHIPFCHPLPHFRPQHQNIPISQQHNLPPDQSCNIPHYPWALSQWHRNESTEREQYHQPATKATGTYTGVAGEILLA